MSNSPITAVVGVQQDSGGGVWPRSTNLQWIYESDSSHRYRRSQHRAEASVNSVSNHTDV